MATGPRETVCWPMQGLLEQLARGGGVGLRQLAREARLGGGDVGDPVDLGRAAELLLEVGEVEAGLLVGVDDRQLDLLGGAEGLLVGLFSGVLGLDGHGGSFRSFDDAGGRATSVLATLASVELAASTTRRSGGDALAAGVRM